MNERLRGQLDEAIVVNEDCNKEIEDLKADKEELESQNKQLGIRTDRNKEITSLTEATETVKELRLQIEEVTHRQSESIQ